MVTPRDGIKSHKAKNEPFKDLISSSPIITRRGKKILAENDESDSDLDETDCHYSTISDINSFKDTSECQIKDRSLKIPIRKSDVDRRSLGKGIYPNLAKFRKNKANDSISENEWIKRGPGPMILILFGLLFIASIFIIGIFLFKSTTMMPRFHQRIIKDLNEVHTEIKRNLKVLSNEMTQTRHFWITIGSNVADVVEDSPPQPSIILALVPKDAQRTASCLIQRITEDISASFEDSKVLMYDGMSVKSQNWNVVSHEMEEFFQELQHYHTAIIHNLEKIPPKSAMILHAFCDNENAPHKRALIILTVGVDVHYNNLPQNTNVDRILENLWRDELRDVDSAAVISRIANSPVVIKPEDRQILDKLCPYK